MFQNPHGCWLASNCPTLGGRSKSSCSPDLGIESDTAIARPLEGTLKITESMSNLLSDEDNQNANRDMDIDNLVAPSEGLLFLAFILILNYCLFINMIFDAKFIVAQVKMTFKL